MSFGFERLQWARIARPEKALLDEIWHHKRMRVRPRTEELYLTGILDPARFLSFADDMGLRQYIEELGLADPAKWPEIEPQVM